MRTTHKIANASPVALFTAAIITLALATIAFPVIFRTKAHSAERGKCVATTVAAKAKKQAPTPEPTTLKKKSKSVITITYEGSRKPVSFDAKGNATYHEGMVPVMKMVDLSGVPSDAGIATKREGGLVESHVVMRLYASAED